jgi:hypothetical protein
MSFGDWLPGHGHGARALPQAWMTSISVLLTARTAAGRGQNEAQLTR